MFDVMLSGSAIGFVWRDAEAWHASVVSMTDRSISAPTRELAVDQLCTKWTEIVGGT